MIRMEYPRVRLDGLPADEKAYALQRQVDILTYNLQIVLDSIEEDLQSAISSFSGESNDSGEGSGGTTPSPSVTSYSDLTDKPQIKGVTLIGNKSFSDLGLYTDPDLLYLTNSEIEEILRSGGGTVDPIPIGAEIDYNDLLNKPMIKGILVQGNKSFTDFGLYSDPDLVTLSNTDIQNLIDSSI